MGIKLRKKESMEHCDSCGATMSEYEYDRYGGLCKLCRGEESKAHGADGKASGRQGNEARMHLGRCKNCGSGWTKTNYLDELEPDIRKYFKDKGYADNADICPKCVAAAKKYLVQGKASGSPRNEAAYTAIKNPEEAAFIIDCVSPEKAKALCDAFSALAEKVMDHDDKEAGDAIGRSIVLYYNVGPFFTACVDPCDKAAKWCEEWLRNSGGAVPGLQGNSAGLESTFTDTFCIQYLDEFDPEFSGKEVMVKGTGADRAAAKKDAINKFYDEHPDAEIHAVK